MQRSFLPLVLVLGLGLAATGDVSAAEHRLGLGAHFWKSVDSLVDDRFSGIEDDGFAWVGSYQYDPRGILRFELDLEYYDGGFGGSTDSALAPIVFALVGGKLYAGAGIGVTVADTLPDDVSDPFYAARIGYELWLLPGIAVDVNVNYRAETWSGLDEFDSDTLTLGAIVRFNL